MFYNLLSRRALIKLLWILRGHRRLSESNTLHRINTLKLELSLTPCIKGGKYSKFVFGKNFVKEELIIRQYILARIEAAIFSREILFSVGKSNSEMKYPLPYEWRKIVIKHGFRINNFNNGLRWNVFVILKFGSSFFSFLTKICSDLVSLFKINNLSEGRYVFFDTLSQRNFPSTSSKNSINNIFTWYLNWPGRTPTFNFLCHDVKGINKVIVENIPVIPISSVFPPISKISGLVVFLLWSLRVVSISLFDLIRGNWWHALLFGESYKSKIFTIVDHKLIAKDYLFHNSSWIYRPLWTYEAEKRGSRILFYFYSTNVEGFKQSIGYPPAYFGWKTSTWSNVLVWDKEQQDFVKRSLDMKVNTLIVGSIWFESGIEEIPVLPSNTIAVFDVQPVRDAFYNTLGISFDYYVPENCNQFLMDIYEVLTKNNLTLVLKRKRNIGKLIHYKYQNLLKELENKPNFVSLDPDLRAQQIIENCKAVISMPFTATALIAKEMGKSTIYYDPCGLIQRDDRGAHGIKIIRGKKELDDWLHNLMEEPVMDLN
jgi:polysaccharide biosynthesis PFTS motif protein